MGQRESGWTRDAGPGEAEQDARLVSRLDDSKCMERLPPEPTGVPTETSSMPLVPEEEGYLITFNKY